MKDVASPTVLAGRYELQREIGRGGMGAVFLARDLKHDSRVAVKMLGAGFGSADAIDRFLGEIRTTAQLNHAHILTIHDSGEADGELYYVMPHIEGASLRDRLDRESRLSIHEALRIGCQIARALAYAHSHGVIHRDVKPENILLDAQGHPYLMDFGLARALSSITVGRRTAHGMTVGSPPYMSPEQAAGEDVDGRSDIYSLGCVLFEMLVGAPPFAAPNAQALLRKHLTEPAPSLRSRRADIPESLDRLVRTALAKDPAQRQPTADALGREVEAVLDSTGRRPRAEPQPRPWLRPAALVAGIVVAVTLLVVAVSGDGTVLWRFVGEPPDSTRWIVLPLQWTEGSEPSPDGAEDRLLYGAFDRWADLSLVPRQTVMTAMQNADPLSAGFGPRLAREMDAGRVVQGLATRLGDSIQIDFALTEAHSRQNVRSVSARVPANAEAAAAHYAVIVDSLLFGRVSWSDGPEWDIGTSSHIARRSYGAAHDALRVWDIQTADSLFHHASERDPEFARARFWLAQLASWRGAPPRIWLAGAQAAVRGNLDSRERVLATALVALGEERYPDACRDFDVLRARDDRDFAAWFGLAQCHLHDDFVTRDALSPTGWRYRASYHRGVLALRHAFDLEPGSYRLFRDASFRRLRDNVLYTRHNFRRDGRNVAGGEFTARPQWLGDTLLFVPFPKADGMELAPSADGVEEATARLQLIFRGIARGWAIAFPGRSDVTHAVALSLEMTGDEAALDTLLRARDLATTRAERIELSIQEVWLRLKLGAFDGYDLEDAAALADSVLRSPEATNPAVAGRMAALAVLLGRPAAAASYARVEAGRSPDGNRPSGLTTAAAALLAFASVGAPVDSISGLERFTEAVIRNTLPRDSWHVARTEAFQRAAWLAHPVHVFAFAEAHGERLPHPSLLGGFLRGDTARTLETIKSSPRGGTPDMAYPRAALAAMAGDTSLAIAILDTVLANIRWLQPGIIEQMPHAGAIVRSMMLRAELSPPSDRALAAQLARGAGSLWSRGEPAVQPAVARMRRLTPRLVSSPRSRPVR